jgi:hypothetical protein
MLTRLDADVAAVHDTIENAGKNEKRGQDP